MGVPRLFKWISEKNASSVRNLDFPATNIISVDNLFIDANAIIHVFAQKVFNYGSYKKFLYYYKNLSYDQKIEKVYERTFDYIMSLARFCPPKKTLYVAIDGVAPAGKMAQQRQRRFIASLGPSSNCETEKKFNPNCISPGTEFMGGLRSYFQYRILLNTLKIPLIVFSSSDVPGEGEHKALEFLRESTLPTDKNAIFGPDGDLIMLTLGSGRDFFLLRENMYEINRMHVIDIVLVKRKIEEVIPSDDFILMGFFVGNDFLPKLQAFYFLEDGMNFLIEVYKILGKPLTENKNILFSNFLEFCKIIKDYEKQFLESQIPIARKAEKKFKNNTLLKCVIKRQFDYDQYRNSYNKKINFDVSLVKNYITGIKWVFDYYLKGCTNFSYCYEHHYAPLVIDLVNYFKEPDPLPITAPNRQIEQLLAILPKISKELLPESCHKVYDAFPEYYPTTFAVDYEGKYQDYQGVAHLPFVDFDKIKKFAKDIPCRKGYILYFRPCSTKKKYKTKYGVINVSVDVRKK